MGNKGVGRGGSTAQKTEVAVLKKGDRGWQVGVEGGGRYAWDNKIETIHGCDAAVGDNDRNCDCGDDDDDDTPSK